MKYYSTNHQAAVVDLPEAVLRGLAPDGGLYLPTEIPSLSKPFLANLSNYCLQEIACEAASPFLAGAVPLPIQTEIIQSALNFEAPLIALDADTYVLELFHGPTLAFKDFGARFLARLLGYFVRGWNRELIILVATSGDTGSAVGQGFLKVPGIKVALLYPAKQVSSIQEQQLTTMGHNITAYEVSGSFDDCQQLVKTAFLDADLNDRRVISSANSINIARLLPQSFYYLAACAQIKQNQQSIVVSVPSGNLGNLTAGIIAQRLGASIEHFVAALNSNCALTDYLAQGRLIPRPSISTHSNAMDVGNPSNLARLKDLFSGDLKRLRNMVSSYNLSNAETEIAILKIYQQYNYIADPHSAVGWAALQRHFNLYASCNSCGVFLATAHPAKFPELVAKTIGVIPSTPDRLQACLAKKKNTVKISTCYEDLKSTLLEL